MIKIKLNEANFEYDIYHLIRAFYPQETVEIITPEAKDKYEGAQCLMEGRVQYLSHQLKISMDYQEGADGVVPSFFHQVAEWNIDYENRKETKNILKRAVYKMLSNATGRTLSWGTLTGIRPVKIISDLLESGSSLSQAERVMKKTYLIGEEKTKLGLSIAQKEKEIMERVKGKYSLYIGIPFCPTTCLYCSFTSYPILQWKDRMEDYIRALFLELDFLAGQLKKEEISTIYIGGGTPTSLPADLLKMLLGKLSDTFYHEGLLEFTVEAGRPDSITEEKLSVMKTFPVSRISINPQTMNQRTLDYIGRRHTVEQTIRCFEMAREHGFDNINMDLILGLPNEGMAEIAHTMEEIKKLSPDNLTIHSMAVKRASKWNQILESRKEQEEKRNGADREEELLAEKMMSLAMDTAKELSLNPYYLYRQKNMKGNLENIGFAKEGKEGIYNILIMEERQNIFAAGAGAMSKFLLEGGRILRVENVKDVKNYLERTEEMIDRKRIVLSTESVL